MHHVHASAPYLVHTDEEVVVCFAFSRTDRKMIGYPGLHFRPCDPYGTFCGNGCPERERCYSR